MRRGIGTLIALAVVLAACSSGPSYEALLRNEPPPTTTTTEPPPEGVTVIRIENGKFTPSNLEIDIDQYWIVRWINNDPPREYVVMSRTPGIFESQVLAPGDSFEFDFTTVDPGLYRYHTFIGNQRIPGLVDTRPAR